MPVTEELFHFYNCVGQILTLAHTQTKISVKFIEECKTCVKATEDIIHLKFNLRKTP